MLSRSVRYGARMELSRRVRTDKAIGAMGTKATSGQGCNKEKMTIVRNMPESEFITASGFMNVDEDMKLKTLKSSSQSQSFLHLDYQIPTHFIQKITKSSEFNQERLLQPHIRLVKHDFFHMSDVFRRTMQNVLLRANESLIDSHTYNRLQRKVGNPFCNETRHISNYDYGQMHQFRQFSSNSQPSGNKEEEKQNAEVIPSEKTTMKAPTPKATTAVSKSLSSRAQAMLTSAIKSLVSIIAKLPGVLWFYLTNPKEFKEKLTQLKEAAKKEAHHYYMGSKLLMADLRTARQMVGRTLQGSPLTRRERKQLVRTVTDVFRLVPMSIFVLIPFMEFALPFALKIFPNMLPSTFQDSLKAEENMKRELKSRLAMAEFFQETLHDLAKDQKKRAESKKQNIVDNDGPSSDLESTENREETAASFLEFMEKARNGEFLPPEVVVRYAKYFKDELTLDNMPRMQLINMCRYMSIPPYGNDNVLRFQLRHKVRGLIEDDQRILWEGIDSLTKMELREACQDRGMRSTGLSKQAYKRALQQWIDLSINQNVPISLLVMSRTFFLQEEIAPGLASGEDESKSVAGLADAISGFDKEIVNEVILETVTPDEKKDPDLLKLKLEVLEQQNELIEEEKQQRDAEAAKAEAAKTEKEKATKSEDLQQSGLAADDEISRVAVSPEQDTVSTLENSVKAEENQKEMPKETVEEETEKEEEDKSLSSEEIDAISQLVSPDPVSAEREKLESLKAALNEDTENEGIEESEFVEDKSEKISDKQEAEPCVEEQLELITINTMDEIADTKIAAMDQQAKSEQEESTQIVFDDNVENVEDHDGSDVLENDEEKYTNRKLDKAVSRLKKKVESMVGNLEIQISDVEAKIGDKLHFLDKDMDGILSREEMAICLRSVLKRPLSFDEAMAIAAGMDENEDGFFSVEELSKWLQTNKLVKLVEEGRDAEIDKIIEAQAEKMEKQNEASTRQ